MMQDLEHPICEASCCPLSLESRPVTFSWDDMCDNTQTVTNHVAHLSSSVQNFY